MLNLSTGSRYFILLCLVLSCYTSLAQQPASATSESRTLTSINNRWQFAIDSAQHSYGSLKQLTGWQNINLPHTWNATDVLDDEHTYYRGNTWYKKQLRINPADKGKQFWLVFDGVNQEATIFVNGKKAGEHIGGYTGFSISISGLLRYEVNAGNEIAVRVSNRYNENIPPLTADFTFFGGIYRNAYLVTTSPIHFNLADFGSNGIQITTPLVNEKQASIRIKSQVTNSSGELQKVNVITKLFNREGVLVAQVNKQVSLKPNSTDTLLQQIPAVKQVHLWSPQDPYLYHITTSIQDKASGKTTDEVTNPLGFRWFKFDPDQGFFLNGKPCKLIGASRHQDYKNLGNAVPQDLQRHDVELLKAMGGNFLRVAHYPQDPVILEMCDKLGIIASVEIPVVNGITETDAFTKNCSNMLREMIRQNFNHPSVVMWAYMNEVLLRPKYGKNQLEQQQQYFAQVTRLAKHLENICHTEDPYRYTLMSNHGDFNLYNRTGLTAIPQVVGWNLYQGWYGGDINGFAKFLDMHHAQLPQKPVMVTEYGADADDRIHALQPVRFDKSIEYAEYYHEVYLQAIQQRPFVAGAAAWNLADFGSESREETMPHINNKGLLTYDRKPKATYYLYQAALQNKPFIKISSQTPRMASVVNQDTTCLQPVTIYSNLKEVSLLVNGNPITTSKKTAYGYIFDVPFKNGANQIEAIGKEGTKEYKDYQTIGFMLQSTDLKQVSDGSSSINILLGASRYFYDELTQQLWQPDQTYTPGSWGSVGGQPLQVNNGRQKYGSDKAIAGTDNDPIYQTQQVGIDSYRFDVADGRYELNLHFAELAGGKVKDPLPYNLNNSVQNQNYQERIFDVYINNKLVLKNFNIAAEAGFAWAISKSIPVMATGGQGVQITFKSIKGQAMLNALQLRRIY
ncbi:DUF4982 domain-containing protein [Mucilaginibacter sp. Bleaf8]|uniref:glycoside hydrolase family 2 TIM barrel-domain containing protein n=1 Tax=Mucilaginibacter sp. Bleaf8 TaxID=2834430 RepID=UPI001BCE9430|nr:glycoside hydrolase family 2 TIM barrel-domain containing protein [Mucilaginibacter sp. Bleaf8]MBS7564830.1 DUF4982 domain-containing protein [Mucilaginibacter sp. Bleaf8]